MAQPGTTETTEPTGHRYRRNLAVLTVAQALFLCGTSVDLTLTGLVGYRLAPTPALATLPAALITVVTLAGTGPAAALLARYGRRVAFPAGSIAAAAGGLISVLAVSVASFPLFCLGTALVGGYQAAAGYYSFAAADDAPTGKRGRAIATVLIGGVVAAVVGPFLATTGVHVLPVPFAGAYLLVTVLAVVSAGLLRLLREPPAATPTDEPDTAGARPLREIMRTPRFVAGGVGGALAYLVMSLLMTAAPIAAVNHHHSVAQGASVVQWHLVGMFLPALVSGHLVQWLRPVPVLVDGILLSAAGAVVAATGTGVPTFMVSLILVGVGWNLMFVAATTLVAAAYRPSERVRTQTAAQTMARVASAAGSLSAGALLTGIGWDRTALLTLIPLAIAAACLVPAIRARAATPAEET
ncbi:MFS transporter [Actinocatenispora sera]|uniref:MFS transporter n=1 Tax=Actinocatenispora sera TaxID=390989 RepID=A0A810L8L4_9ACTN|nr:MFS transporter [Actinocatenispora sera]BCJ31549.1 MFS transporter [Actinocatenispora sera]